MKKKIKIFGIVTSVLLIMLSLTPVATSYDPSGLANEIEVFIANNQVEINALDAFIENYGPDQDIPVEFSESVYALCIELKGILDPYIEKEPEQEWGGMTSVWFTTNKVPINENHPDWEYIGIGFSLNNAATDLIITAMQAPDFTAGVLFLILIDIFDFLLDDWFDWLAWLLEVFVYATFGTILAFLQWIKDYNLYGFVMFLYKPDIMFGFLFLDIDIFQQLDHPWIPNDYYEDGEPKHDFDWYLWWESPYS